MSKEPNKSIYGQRPAQPFVPSENIPDLVNVPDKTIYVLTEDQRFNDLPSELIESLAGQKGRDWFTEHFYFCLPITFGNQHGFIVRLMHNVVVRWGGQKGLESLKVHLLGTTPEHQDQIISSHFGSGILTIQNRWTYRTPKGINLMVTPPPNFPIEGIMHMSAVVETDQLRRDFTFNLKVTTPNRDFYIPKGTPIGCVLPYPRHFIDNYQIALHPPGEVFANERKAMQDYGNARTNYDQEIPGLLYMKGVDIYGNKFTDHQKSLPVTPLSQSQNEPASRNNINSKKPKPRYEGKLDKALDVEALRQSSFPSFDAEGFRAMLFYILERKQEGYSGEAIVDMFVAGGWDKDLVIKVMEKVNAD
jgi:hypothetical protein